MLTDTITCTTTLLCCPLKTGDKTVHFRKRLMWLSPDPKILTPIWNPSTIVTKMSKFGYFKDYCPLRLVGLDLNIAKT